MPHLVALKPVSRYPAPVIGPFVYVPQYERHVWKGTVSKDAAHLAQAISEALPWMNQNDNPFLELQVVAVPTVATEAPQTVSGSAAEEALREENLQLQQTNEELRETVRRLSANPRKLKPLQAAETAAA